MGRVSLSKLRSLLHSSSLAIRLSQHTALRCVALPCVNQSRPCKPGRRKGGVDLCVAARMSIRVSVPTTVRQLCEPLNSSSLLSLSLSLFRLFCYFVCCCFVCLSASPHVEKMKRKGHTRISFKSARIIISLSLSLESLYECRADAQ